MPKSKHRKNHKAKVNNRKVELESQKNRMAKYQEKYFQEIRAQYEKQMELKAIADSAQENVDVIEGIDNNTDGVEI